MKLTKFFIAVLFVIPFVQSCQDDVSELDDPRDAIVKVWRASEVGGASYDVEIMKDNNDKTKIFIKNFHNLQSTEHLSATLVGKNIVIPNQTLDAADNFTQASGLIANDYKTITLNYYWEDGNAAAEAFQVVFGEPAKKKVAPKKVTPTL